jgi:hypothetical protein
MKCGGDLSRIGLENVFQRAAILGRASFSCFVIADLDSWKPSRITIIISSRCGEHKEPACAPMILPTHTGLVGNRHSLALPNSNIDGITINASFSIIVIGKISAAISTAFSFVTALGESCSPAPKDVFRRAAVLGRASISKQLDGHCWTGQKKGDQECSEVGHRLLRSSSAIPRGKVNLSKRVWEKSVQRDETHSAESDKIATQLNYFYSLKAVYFLTTPSRSGLGRSQFCIGHPVK